MWNWSQCIGRFQKWLDSLEGLPIENPLSVLKWNLNKRYLGELAERGIPVIPTAYASTI